MNENINGERAHQDFMKLSPKMANSPVLEISSVPTVPTIAIQVSNQISGLYFPVPCSRQLNSPPRHKAGSLAAFPKSRSLESKVNSFDEPAIVKATLDAVLHGMAYAK